MILLNPMEVILQTYIIVVWVFTEIMVENRYTKKLDNSIYVNIALHISLLYCFSGVKSHVVDSRWHVFCLWLVLESSCYATRIE